MTKRIKKYKPNYAIQVSHPHLPVISEDENGNFVRLEDYEELKKEYEEFVEGFKKLCIRFGLER